MVGPPLDPELQGVQEQNNHSEGRALGREGEEPLVPQHDVGGVVAAHEDAGHDHAAEEDLSPVSQKGEDDEENEKKKAEKNMKNILIKYKLIYGNKIVKHFSKMKKKLKK